MFCFNQTLVKNHGWIQSPGFDVDPALDGVMIAQPLEMDCWITLIAPGKLSHYTHYGTLGYGIYEQVLVLKKK